MFFLGGGGGKLNQIHFAILNLYLSLILSSPFPVIFVNTACLSASVLLARYPRLKVLEYQIAEGNIKI